ncbi:hypothetical protein [Qipengyuania sp. DGS5-3]|uniref:hypothetical protein n=1 Tax=Qipengyuania sp. DGS5-3 TaxID=3349632 RepID=UPI0036D41ACF
MLIKFDHEKLAKSLIFEDDGRTAYAYMLSGDDIVSDVWLYNVCTAPIEPEWHDRSKMPFANPKDFVLEEHFEPVTEIADVTVEWDIDCDRNLAAVLYLSGKKHAYLYAGGKPGKCRLAIKPSPVALPLCEIS